MIIQERAPAKINIGLAILGKRDDGYHAIRSLFQTVALYDDLEIDDEAGPGLVCPDSQVPENSDNLVLKAERAFRETTGLFAPVRFTLVKRIPVGAGLGGGSADAAAALRGLARLHSMDKKHLLHSCAEKIGSDVPFLLKGGSAVVGGRGEDITPVHLTARWHFVIIFPGFSVSTAWAYGNVRSYSSPDSRYLDVLERLARGSADGGDIIGPIMNDFERVVFPEYPVLLAIRDDIANMGAETAFLTGSGSSMAGVFMDRGKAEKCADVFRNRGMRAWAVDPVH